MPTGAITQYIDVAQVVLYMFWVFFAGVVFYLHRENKREGYPFDSEGTGRRGGQGFPSMPTPKSYLLRSGRVVTAPNPERDDDKQWAARVVPAGAPNVPSPSPFTERVGPGSYALRADEVDLTATNEPRIVPLRTKPTLGVQPKDVDPRGLPVIGTDGVVGGVVRDLWVDQAESLFRYLEVEVAGAPGTVVTPGSAATTVTPGIVGVAPSPLHPGVAGAATARTVLLPMGFARIKRRGIVVDSLTGAQFAFVPTTRLPDRVTLLEEEKIMGYYGAGTLYATPKRAEPLL